MHLVMSRLTGDTPLPPVGKPSPWSRKKLTENRDGSRYFGIANFIRGSLNWWPLLATWNLHVLWITGLTIFLMGFHYASVLLEIYKIKRVDALLPNAPEEGQDPAPNASSPKYDWYFAPKKFESEKFYWILLKLKFIVTVYIDRTKLTPEERKAGKKAEYLGNLSRAETVPFEFATRVGEGLHFTAFWCNAPLAIGLFLHHKTGPGILISLLMLSDVLLALLQRCHRLRVWRVVVKMRGRT
jgi:hypothetical protein